MARHSKTTKLYYSSNAYITFFFGMWQHSKKKGSKHITDSTQAYNTNSRLHSKWQTKRVDKQQVKPTINCVDFL